jgi:hypothetical protein
VISTRYYQLKSQTPGPFSSSKASFLTRRYSFKVPIDMPTVVLAKVFSPEVIEPYTCLRMFDNDGDIPGKLREIPQAFYLLKPQLCMPNKNGYTIVADCKIPTAKPATRWKLRLFTKPALSIFSPERPLEGMSTRPLVMDFEDTFITNKHNVLFRYKIKVKDAAKCLTSMQLVFGLPSISVKLQLFDHDVEVFCAKGKGCVTNHATFIYANSPEGDSESTVSSARRGSVKNIVTSASVFHPPNQLSSCKNTSIYFKQASNHPNCQCI